ncbi:2-oxo-4-hydroxy-4-carboxy-5-ureidoimidazoline decarboxylase [Paenibacillus harenae]|uniref:2-oxo-4-hydroxy-4-carboxy-5-ureidoimidazoline decarboxylase n=1 Tax=Paenibacillus harenae TaxID=306543 RepID=A0ABT9U9M1_PAEHA|nr:2-oxo-4-hydroxy-4-carboxy-5-ureidoimidazoline decarboxylase [Paenibacillus harenae]MDQ0116283.1 2-oxo-4-hydroxy-4-carboxy-5-ureidoimidazoline decarboxylase [Paenibacillus harenae]
MTTMNEMNELDRQAFVAELGEIFEHSPWIANAAWEQRPFASVEALHEAMANVVREASKDQLIELFRAHPDLGTRLAVAPYSAKEQQGAGLNQLTSEEYEVFSEMNRKYVEQFGFPFILAVRGKTKEDILAAMESRILNSLQEETTQALSEIEKITKFRIQDLITG